MNTKALTALAALFAVNACTPDRIVRSDGLPHPPGKPVSSTGEPNHAPTISDFTPFLGYEGNPVLFGATASDPDGTPLTWDWVFGDGTPGSNEPNPSHVYADNGFYPVTVNVFDGELEAWIDAEIEILNVAPKVRARLDQRTVTVGEPMSITAEFDDPGMNDTWTVEVNWDGQPSCEKKCPPKPEEPKAEAPKAEAPKAEEPKGGKPPVVQPGSPVTLTHTFEEPGDYVVTVAITDKDGGVGKTEVQVSVLPAGETIEQVGPAILWTGLKNSDAAGLRIDLLAELLVDDVVVASGELVDQPAGSSGFNNAKLRKIAMSLARGPLFINAGAPMGFRVSVRRTCFGGGHNSGTVRLWYDGAPIDDGSTRDAGSRLPMVVSRQSSEWFLRAGSALSTDPGTARQFVDAAVNSSAACPDRPYVAFGTWAARLP